MSAAHPNLEPPPPAPISWGPADRDRLLRRVAFGLRVACLLLLVLAVVFTVKATAFAPAPPRGPLLYGAAPVNPLQSFNDELLALLLAVLSIACGMAAAALDRGFRP